MPFAVSLLHELIVAFVSHDDNVTAQDTIIAHLYANLLQSGNPLHEPTEDSKAFDLQSADQNEAVNINTTNQNAAEQSPMHQNPTGNGLDDPEVMPSEPNTATGQNAEEEGAQRAPGWLSKVFHNCFKR
ncbi:hypothetical protein G7046_g1784 [Stylonectria norvegica]|nr:hypothetical protein G7046_g1784 [Stylonectria norvegica]